jgi:carbamoyltransferase
MNILGINAYHADVSAVLVRDGQLVAAVEEERFRRIKHVTGFPDAAIRTCLEMGELSGAEVDRVAVSRQPTAHFLKKAWFAATHRPGRSLLRHRAANYQEVARIPGRLAALLDRGRTPRRRDVDWVEHHPSHLASAFFVSPFDDSAVCAIDGFGDFVSTSWGVGRGAHIDVRHRTFFPHSLGLFYLALTQYLGFTQFGDEYKVMGLAPYGTPDYASKLRQVLRLLPEGDIALDLSYFSHWTSSGGTTWNGGAPVNDQVYSPRLEDLLGPARRPDQPITSAHQAIAASLQAVFEEGYFHVLRAVHRSTRRTRLCLAGGCAMNSVANGKIRQETPFTDVFIQPAAGDNGTALGAAYWVWHQQLGSPRRFVMAHGYWGPSFVNGRIDTALRDRSADLTQTGCRVTVVSDAAALCDWTAGALAEGLAVGWFQGPMEWGARALGNRSILADPRRADMRDTLNAKIKSRESFRPFAPSVLEEAHREYFTDSVIDPFMLQVYAVRPEKRAVIPAVTHVDGSGRPQTVSQAANPLYWSLLKAFERRTGVPVLLNTSFNEGEPIVHHPSEAIDCFLRTRLDVLVIGEHAITKPHVAAPA